MMYQFLKYTPFEFGRTENLLSVDTTAHRQKHFESSYLTNVSTVTCISRVHCDIRGYFILR